MREREKERERELYRETKSITGVLGRGPVTSATHGRREPGGTQRKEGGRSFLFRL